MLALAERKVLHSIFYFYNWVSRLELAVDQWGYIH